MSQLQFCNGWISVCKIREFLPALLQKLVGDFLFIFTREIWRDIWRELCGFFDPQKKGSKLSGKNLNIRAFFVRKFVAQQKFFVQNSLCRRATLNRVGAMGTRLPLHSPSPQPRSDMLFCSKKNIGGKQRAYSRKSALPPSKTHCKTPSKKASYNLSGFKGALLQKPPWFGGEFSVKDSDSGPKVRVTGRKSELRTKSRRYSRADPQNPNRIAQNRAPNWVEVLLQKTLLKAFLNPPNL